MTIDDAQPMADTQIMSSEVIDHLMKEHQYIAFALSAFQTLGEAVMEHASYERRDLIDFVRFLREYSDGYHHRKEEYVLFELLMKGSTERWRSSVDVLLSEHAQGDVALKKLEVLSESAVWGAVEMNQVVEAIGQYVGLIRDHIRKEELLLFTLAEKMVDDAGVKEMSVRLRSYEAENAIRRRNLEAQGGALIARFGGYDPFAQHGGIPDRTSDTLR